MAQLLCSLSNWSMARLKLSRRRCKQSNFIDNRQEITGTVKSVTMDAIDQMTLALNYLD